MACSVAGCTRTTRLIRGWCKTHYTRWRRHGDPNGPVIDYPTCKVDGCTRKIHRRGMCSGHYKTYLKEVPESERSLRPAVDRFFECFDKDGPVPDGRPDLGPCWEWTRGRSKAGYGVFYLGVQSSKQVLAHRWSLAYYLGRELASDKEVLHECDNPPCVNPHHLREDTHEQNMADASSRGRSAKVSELITHCIHDHPFSEENTMWGTRTTKAGRVYRVRKCRKCNNSGQNRRRRQRKENAA